MQFVALLIALVAAIVQKSLAEGRVKWNVTVFTGTAGGAETDSKLILQVFGDSEFTDYEILKDFDSRFDTGAQDFYQFTSGDIGFPTYIRVRAQKGDRYYNYEERYRYSWHWQMDKIEMQSDQEDAKLVRFTYNSWFDNKGKGNDAFIAGRAVDTEWSVRVTTSKEPDAGYDGDAWLQICGPNSCTETMVLQDEEQEVRIKDATDEFKFVDVDVGNPTFILVWVNKGTDKWSLDKVELKKPGLDTWISYSYGGKWLGGTDWKKCEAFIYNDAAAVAGGSGESKSCGKLQPAGLLLSAGLGLCLMVAQM